MGALGSQAATLFPDYNPDGSPYSPKLSDLRAMFGLVDNAIPNAQDLGAEVAARQSGDAGLSAAVTAEQNARAAGLAQETARAQSAEAAITAAVSAEQTARASAVAQEAARASSAEQANAAAIQAEQGARAQETARASAAEAGLSQAIQAEQAARAAETARATAAEAAETARAEEVEAALGKRVDSVSADIAAATTTADAAAADAAAAVTASGAAVTTADAASAAVTNIQATVPLNTRPGDSPSAFTADLAATTGGIPPNSTPATTPAGRVLRVSGAAIVASLGLRRVEPVRTYLVRFVLSRWVDTDDPVGDGVLLGLAWYGPDRSLFGWAPLVSPALDLRVRDGRVQVSALVSTAPATPDTVVPPPGAAYLRPYVQTFGPTPVTDLEVIEHADITTAGLAAPNVDDLRARVDALAMTQRDVPAFIAADGYIDALLFGGP